MNTTIDSGKKAGNIKIEHNGERMTLKDEVAKKILACQRKGNALSLQHDVLILAQDQQSSESCAAVQNVLNESDINWNILTLQGTANDPKIPEIFSHLKPMKLISAAAEAGIIKLNHTLHFIGYGLTVLICLIVSTMISLCPEYNLQGFKLDNSIILSFSIITVAGLLIYSLGRNYLLQKNRKLYNSIIQYVNNIDSANSGDNIFIDKVCEKITSMEMPLAIVVGDIDKLDPFTRNTLRRVVTSDPQQTVGLIMWVILAQSDSGFVKEWVTLDHVPAKIYRLVD